MAEVWKTQPIVFEFYCEAAKFAGKNWDIHSSVDWILDNHASLVHVIPFDARQVRGDPAIMAEVRRIDRHVGARIVPEKATWTMDEDGRISVSLSGRNDGVAPIILDYQLVYEARGADGKVIGRWVSSANPRCWLPGAFEVSDILAADRPIPKDVRLTIRLESCGSRFRAFRFGVRECGEDGALEL